MSAIFGIFHPDGTVVEERYLIKMKETIKHYGREKQEIYQSKEIGLGSCLSAKNGNSHIDQPVYYDRKQEILLVCDALIYNREEILTACGRKDQHIVSTQELLMEAYLKWGEGCVKYLNGDFTFAIWDMRQRRLRIFRDHLGVRPLYYAYQDEVFAFATDYRALLALPFIGKQLNKTTLYALLSDTYHIDTQSTYFEQIKRLPQAHYLWVDHQGLSKKKYWTPGEGEPLLLESEEEYANQLHSIVLDAIKVRLKVCEGKLASEFSGGLDSSVITVLANREQKKEHKELEAYSWSPSLTLLPPIQQDERELIEKVGKEEGFECRFRESYLTPREMIESPPALTDGQRSDELRQIMQDMSSQEISMVMSGWGGDEGISHRADCPELFLHGYYKLFMKEVRKLTKGSILRMIKYFLCLPLVLLWRPYSFFGRQSKDIPNIIKKSFRNNEKRQCKRDILHLKTNPIKHLESGVTVSRTELTAWVGADYEIQYLFPFLDRRVVEFAMSIPRHLYYKDGIPRYIYRKAFQDILPKEIIENKSKIDPAREKQWSIVDDLQKKAECVLEQLDKEMFYPYIEWDKVEELVKNQFFQERSRGSIFNLIKLQVCYDILRIIKDVRDYSL